MAHPKTWIHSAALSAFLMAGGCAAERPHFTGTWEPPHAGLLGPLDVAASVDLEARRDATHAGREPGLSRDLARRVTVRSRESLWITNGRPRESVRTVTTTDRIKRQ